MLAERVQNSNLVRPWLSVGSGEVPDGHEEPTVEGGWKLVGMVGETFQDESETVFGGNPSV